MKSLVEIVEPIQHVNILRNSLADDGTFPNNGLLPLLVYRKAIRVDENAKGKLIIELFESNGWSNAWENGIYDYHHYHSITHEVLESVRDQRESNLEESMESQLNFRQVML